MPQFAFDGIFAPFSTAPPAPQRSSSAPFGDDLFDKHLSQARQLPEPYPIEPGSPPNKPPQCTTGPVSPDRPPVANDVKKKPVADRPCTTNAPCEEAGRGEQSSNAADHAAGSAAPTVSQEAGATADADKDVETVDESSTEVNQLDAEALSQNNAVAAALASVELAVKPEVAQRAVPQEETEDVLISRHASKKVKRLEASNPKGQVEPARREVESADVKAAPSSAPAEAVEGDAPVAVDELSVAAAPVEESATQKASLISTTEQVTEAQTAQSGAQRKSNGAAATSTQVDKTSSNRPLGDANGDPDDAAAAALDTGAEKANSTTRRRETQAARPAEPTVESKAQPAVEQNVDASGAAPTVVENSTDTATTVSKDTKSDSVGAIDANKDSAGQDLSEQHTSHGKSQQPLDVARDLSVERTTRQIAAQLRESDTSAPRSQLLTDVEHLRFVQRVARAIGTSATADGGQMRLRLSPPELGSLRMEIVVRQGTVTAHVEAETTAARDVLLDNLPALRERLAEQNIKLERFDVDLMRQSLDQTPQHTGGQDGDRAESGRRTNQTVSRETKQTAEQVAVQAPVIQDGHVNIVI